MKNIVLTAILVSLLSACSQKSNENSNEKQPDILINAGVGIVTGTGEFGSMGPKDSKLLSIQIKNTGDTALQGPPIIDSTDFSIVYQSAGCASIAPGKRCDLKINFNASGKLFQSYSANLNLDTVLLSLSATVVDPNPNPILTTSVAFSANPLDFGTLTDKQTSLKTLTITNTGSSLIQNQTVSIGSDFSIASDGCSNKSILPGKSCLLKISFNGSGKSGVINDTISFVGSSSTLTAQVVSASGSSSLGSPNVQFLIDNSVTNSYNLGTLSGTQSKQVIIVAKNNGTKASNLSTTQLSSLGYTIAFDQCNNKSLAPGASCQIRVLFSASGKNPNTYTNILSFAEQSLNLSVQVTSSSVPVITYQVQYSPYGECSASTPCVGQGTQFRTALCIQYNNGIEVGPVDNSNCSFIQLSQVCNSPAGTKVVSIDYGSKTVLCDEGSNLENYLSVSCDLGYEENNQMCSAIACTLANAAGYGVNLTEVATVSGNVLNCIVSACANSSFFEIAPDQKSCVNKTPTGSITFLQDYTKNLTGNLLNISQNNAQQIQFYSDASCSTAIGVPLSMPLSQTSITLSGGDGIKTAYAKLINGSVSSNCLSDTIILDQTAPLLTITSPTTNARIAGTSLTVSGTCLEVSNPNIPVGITLNGVTQTVACSSGVFSSVFNIGSVPNGNTTISVSATDLVLNTGTNSLIFNRSSCTTTETLSGNTCLENTPAVTNFTILNKNANGYVKDGFVSLSIAGTNATQMKISTNSGCTDGVYESYSTTKSFTIPALNYNSASTLQLYIKLKNINLETSCYTVSGAINVAGSSTYMHDNIAPTATINSPTNGSSFSTTSLTVSGSCTGGVTTGSLIYIKEVGYSENNVSCSTTSYSYSLTLSAATGSKTIQVRQKDLADNETIVSVSVTKTGPPDVPTSFECQPSGGNYPFCTWAAVSGATSYYFYRSTTLAGPYSYVSSSTNTSGSVNTDNSTGTTYYYKVASNNVNGTSAQTSAVGVTNIRYDSPSSANNKNLSKGYITSQSLNSVNIFWDNSMQGATQYKISEYSDYFRYPATPYSFNIPNPISSTIYSSSVSSATVNLASSAPTWIMIEGINTIGTNTSRFISSMLLKKEVGNLLFTRNFLTTPTVQTGETFFDTGTTNISASGLYLAETSSGPSGYKRDFSNAGDFFTPIVDEYYTIRLTFNSVISANNGSYLQVILGNQNNPSNIIYYPFAQLVGKTTIDFHVQSKNTPNTLIDQMWLNAAGSYNRTTQRSSMQITKIEIFD